MMLKYVQLIIAMYRYIQLFNYCNVEVHAVCNTNWGQSRIGKVWM